ncbi:helix-turn-helix domain-containing protein [Bacillus sp. XT-2]|uniref:helix-turn-helix domain-containing protein n=1 Tax=Bacillus sp. XT-2 TaxID=2856852 RepID=UPI0021E0FF9A|nr:helix-turn-helix transcriptional regulator [Bacillus sp. XT-2]MCV0024765.1 helix-turn-helix domain-containing protein [Bacillus sp. XT-2]
MTIVTNELFELIRRHQNMTQEEFANLLGISRKTVSAIERNKRPVSKRTEHKLIQKVPISDSLLNYKMRHDSLKEFIKTEVSQ